MKNLNLINPERRLGGHDFCGVNHANQTEVQIDNLSVSGRSEVSMTLDEQPGNHPVITPLSPSNHPLLPKQKSGKSLIRIGKNVAESHVRKYAGASRVWKYAAMVVLMVTLGVGEMWADITFYYMADMPSSWWTPSNSVTMTQSSTNTNRYYSEVSLTSGKTYGFCIHEGSDVYKNNSTASTNEKFQLYKYGIDNENRSNYVPSTTGTYIFTYDSGTKEIYIGPKSGAKIKIAYDVASGHDDWSNLNNYTDELTQDGTSENYYIDLDLSAQKYYMFVQIKIGDNSYAYWRGTSAITIDGNPASVYHYESNQHTSKDKLNFTPSAATRYRFIWNHRYKTIKIQRLYQVSYNANGGSGAVPSSTYHLSGSTVTVADKGALDKSNYSFAGWNTNNSGSGTNYAAGSGTFTMPASNKTLYAKWTQSVTLNANTSNGGSGSNGSATATWNGTALSGISHPSGATGYTRTGYFTDATGGTKVLDANGTYAGSDITGYITGGKWSRTSSTTLYAQWDNHYTVTLNNQGASSVGTEEVTATYGSAMPAITVPKKNGYIFGGYYTGTNGGGTKYYDEYGASARTWNIALNTTLHAKWTGVSYHVEFNANGGTGTMSNQDLDYGTETALTTNTFTRDGYYFLGWNTNADGSGTAHYDGKSVQNLTTRPGATITLYAQWAKKHTLYFLNMGVDGWNNVSGNQASTVRYAYASISYDGHEMYPLETYSANSSQGTRMTAESAITLTNVNNGESTWCWSIANVPEGATILFSDNTDSHKSSDQSGWTADKPYFCNGNSTWYALDEGETNRISAMTDMSVYFSKGGSSWTYYALDKHDNGTTYAIINLESGVTNYQYTYYNWRTKTHSKQTGNSYIINGSETKVDYKGAWTLNGSSYNVNINTTTHATGEYKFLLTWSGGDPQTTVYIPRGVNLTTTLPIEAKAGQSVTVSLTADAWTNLSSGTDMDNPIYTFQFSTDNSNWTDIAVVSPESNKMQATTDYTFTARSGYFRVKLVNDHGLASYSGSTAFTAYTTKSFYVYNPWNNSTDKWEYLELYTWKENGNADTPYNGSLGDCYIACSAAVGTPGTGCLHGNNIEAMGNNWFKITIDERADYFLLAGNKIDGNYTGRQTGNLAVASYIQDAKYMLIDDEGATLKEYQAKGASDFRLKYTDASGSRYSDIYNTTLDGTTVTASIWMNAASGTSIAIQKGTGSNTWEDVKTYTNSSNGFGELVESGKRDHGYVFQMKVNFNTGEPASSTIEDVVEYTGPFYVRTDGLDGGWNDYKKADHLMVNSEASLAGSPAYNYYLCKWISSAGGNVKFTVANNYNKELVASLGHDAILGDGSEETLPAPANVRFAWNSRTNTLSRAYISGSTNASDRFLVLKETGSVGKIYTQRGVELTTADGGAVAGLNEHELIFADNGNWVYELIMQANPGAQADVTAKFNNKEQDFMTNVALIGGTGSTKYTYRITYDFKTNVLTNAWVPDGVINENIINLNSNIMLIRNGQDAAEELKFGGNYSITGAKKLISVMQFDYDNMVGKMNSWNSQAYQYCMYYISFPFNVDVNKIFGIGTYGTDWKLQYYDGAERASKGFFRGDGTTTFWKDVSADGTLQKYVGYSLLLNRIKFNDGSSDIWENKGAGSSVYLYFPSNEDAGTIEDNGEITIPVPEHKCEINRTFTIDDGNGGTRTLNHMNTDSHWNMMGTPLFEHKTASTIVPSEAINEETLQYFYAWNYADNTLSAKATLANGVQTFNAMQAYMVQYAGNVTFSGAAIHPAGLAARRTAETRNLNIELQVLNANEEEINRTYVQLKDGADADFKLNEDMYMVTNSRAVNIYTYAGDYDVAANVLPLETTTVPVGVTVKTAGTYTFSMPSNFSGTATLVDTYAQTRTNLALEDYTVQLEKGTVNDRFFLEIGINNAPTAIDGVTDGSGSLKDGKAHKFIENGAMYILRDGVIYDARGNKVK